MLVTNLTLNLRPYDSLDPLVRKQLREVYDLLKCHPLCTYDGNGPSPDHFEEIWTVEDLARAGTRFAAEVKRYRVFTFDLEGEPVAPEGLVLLPVGGTCVYVHINAVVSSAGYRTLRDELQFLFDVLDSPEFIKIGSGIRTDVSDLCTAFRMPRIDGRCHILDTHQVFVNNKENGLYHERLEKAIKNKTGLKAIALTHARYDHKCYSQKDFKKNHGNTDSWRDFPLARRILPGVKGQPGACRMYEWRCSALAPYQRVYVYLDATIVVRFLLESMSFAVQEGRIRGETGFHRIVARFLQSVHGESFDPERFGVYQEGLEALDLDDDEVERRARELEDEKRRAKRKRRFERTGRLETRGKVHHLNNRYGTYTNAELWEIRRALDVRESLQMFLHPNEVDESDVFDRYVVQDAKETTRRKMLHCDDPPPSLESLRRKKTRQIMRDYRGAQRDRARAGSLFIQQEPVLWVGRCRNCGGRHIDRSLHCPVQRYHERRNVLGVEPEQRVSAQFFAIWPCLVCTSVFHTTFMCPVLHRWCPACERRGHASRTCEDGLRRERFERFAPLGLMTQLANGSERHPWGYAPKISRMSPEMIDDEDDRLNREGEDLEVDDVYETLLERHRN